MRSVAPGFFCSCSPRHSRRHAELGDAIGSRCTNAPLNRPASERGALAQLQELATRLLSPWRQRNGERLGRRRVHARAPATADTDEAFLTTSASGRRPSHFGGFSLCYLCPRGQLRCPCVCIYGASLVYAPRYVDADEKKKVPATPFESCNN